MAYNFLSRLGCSWHALRLRENCLLPGEVKVFVPPVSTSCTGRTCSERKEWVGNWPFPGAELVIPEELCTRDLCLSQVEPIPTAFRELWSLCTRRKAWAYWWPNLQIRKLPSLNESWFHFIAALFIFTSLHNFFFCLKVILSISINERKCKVIERGIGGDHTSLQPASSPRQPCPATLGQRWNIINLPCLLYYVSCS